MRGAAKSRDPGSRSQAASPSAGEPAAHLRSRAGCAILEAVSDKGEPVLTQAEGAAARGEAVEIANVNTEGLLASEAAVVERLCRLGQAHVLEPWRQASASIADKRRLVAQVLRLEAGYPGGLSRYLDNARALLGAARRGDNPHAGVSPQLPSGQGYEWGSDEFVRAHTQGLKLASRSAFVLVAGGMGERLGYPGIKLSLPVDTATGATYLQFYIRQILALQRLSGSPRPLPLAIMTSSQTHEPTSRLLRDNAWFGMTEEQVSLMLQQEVPALADDRPSLRLASGDPFQLETKPHGHGDVHSLLYSTGLAARFASQGVEQLVFFQDTNSLIFCVLAATLQASRQQGFVMNSIAVPRRAGEAVGGIARLVSEDGSRELTINVEYNQLDPMLRASGRADGDAADSSGFSPYPGNTNALVFELKAYLEALERTGGAVPEFVNPKYTGPERKHFAKATRLECMMQDFPKLLGPECRVGFTRFEREVCFSAVKNSLADAASRQGRGLPPESAGSAEADLFALNRRLLRAGGASLSQADSAQWGGVELELFPVAVLSAEMWQAPVAPGSMGLAMTARASLILVGGRFTFHDVVIDGELEIHAPAGARVHVDGLRVNNSGRRAAALGPEPAPSDAVRGYRLVAQESLRLDLTGPGPHRIDAEWLRRHHAPH